MNEKLTTILNEYEANIKFLTSLLKHLDDVRNSLEEGRKDILEAIFDVREGGQE